MTAGVEVGFRDDVQRPQIESVGASVIGEFHGVNAVRQADGSYEEHLVIGAVIVDQDEVGIASGARRSVGGRSEDESLVEVDRSAETTAILPVISMVITISIVIIILIIVAVTLPIPMVAIPTVAIPTLAVFTLAVSVVILIVRPRRSCGQSQGADGEGGEEQSVISEHNTILG
jgi:hypothetical protein